MMVMRTFAVLLVLLGFGATGCPASAEQSTDCKICREQQRACAQAHSRAACTTEYEFCMKHCRRK
jgi:hypothetical protein